MQLVLVHLCDERRVRCNFAHLNIVGPFDRERLQSALRGGHRELWHRRVRIEPPFRTDRGDSLVLDSETAIACWANPEHNVVALLSDQVGAAHCSSIWDLSRENDALKRPSDLIVNAALGLDLARRRCRCWRTHHIDINESSHGLSKRVLGNQLHTLNAAVKESVFRSRRRLQSNQRCRSIPKVDRPMREAGRRDPNVERNMLSELRSRRRLEQSDDWRQTNRPNWRKRRRWRRSWRHRRWSSWWCRWRSSRWSSWR
mmetsp:Transcript_15976/g.34557  ORF Transcript_15976/g.34557 Transcript_15976/m.34557 type:complete len:257 (+) Transcript_15976:172-942(+)